ncbi:hypothetical protein [Crateriforma conspicua]|uniref:hypothetical protein n=1 Tax=Crateriforma conspicua TaxID=2527996 RepID=UPI00118CE826|nr:hypothetical protein [Crateriforma conspicua]QDV62113.1 hypothetical protein Mal65_12410 [Crateriforma conspicua]
MSSLFRTLSLRAAVVAMLVAAVPTAGSIAQAQEQLAPSSNPAAGGQVSEPVVVLTLGSVSKLQKDVQYLASAVGQPQAAGIFLGMSAMFTNGVDTTQPIAITLPLVNGAPEPVALIPTKDVRTVLKTVEAQTGGFDELDDGTYVISVAGTVIYIKQSGDWAIVSRKREMLSTVPNDPTTLFAGMGNNYDLAVQLKMQLVPANVRAMLIGQLRQGFEQAMERQGGSDDESAAYAESTLDQLEQLIEDTEELFVGWNTNVEAKQLEFDSRFVAVDGSKLSAMYSDQQPIPSRFASVIRDDAAAYFHGAASLGPALVEQSRDSISGSVTMVKKALEQSDELNEDEMADVNELIDAVAGLVMDSIAEGKTDAGGVLLADTGSLQFAMGTFVSDGDEAAQVVKDLAAKLEGKPNTPRFKFDMSEYGGVTIHLIEADVPESEDEARKVLGDVLKVYVGTADEAVYVAIGDASVDLAKELIDSGTTNQAAGEALSQGRILMLPILKYVRSIESNPVIDAMVQSLTNENLSGQVEFTANSIPSGQKANLVIGEGVLKAVGAGIQAGQAAKQADGDF